ncbi:MAG: FAD binding domain-containing protein [Burkholderiales bacterium]
MKPAAFKYHRARTSAEAIEHMSEAGDDARFLAGGQSLVPMMNFRIARPSVLIDLGGCDNLVGIQRDGDCLRIGAMTRQWDAQMSGLVTGHLPILGQALSHTGPDTVRNRGTIGGSIAHAYPLAELPCVAVALDAAIVLESAAGQRTVAASEFFVAALTTSIRAGELVREVVFPCRRPSSRYAFLEAGNHAGGSALAIVCGHAEADANDRLRNVRIAASGIDSKPVRLPRVEAALMAGDDDLLRAYERDLAERARHINDAPEDLVGVLVHDVAKALLRGNA